MTDFVHPARIRSIAYLFSFFYICIPNTSRRKLRVVLHESTDRMIRRSGVLCVHIQKRMYPHQSEQTSKLVPGGSIARSRALFTFQGRFYRPAHTHTHTHTRIHILPQRTIICIPNANTPPPTVRKEASRCIFAAAVLATATIAENQRCTCAKSRLRPHPHMCNKPHSIMQTFANVMQT